MKIQKIVSGVLSVSMLAGMGTMSAFAADDTQKAGISVRVQDKTTGEYEAVVFNDELGMPYQDENDRTMTPLRTIANAMDLEVAWNEEAKTATFTRGNESVVFQQVPARRHRRGQGPGDRGADHGHRCRTEGQPHLRTGSFPG